MSSTRLPGKALLPVGGLPLVVLAALRAGNRGHSVTVLTSTDPSDDVLARRLDEHGIRCVRGSLNDVLARFQLATENYEPSQPVFRMTADNAVPDGALLEEMEAIFQHKALDYLTSTGSGSGLPYGVSAELTRAGYLAWAHGDPTTSAADREHVTPKIRRRFGNKLFNAHAARAQEDLRLTIDTFEDYRRVAPLFEKTGDPLRAHYLEICDLAAAVSSPPAHPSPYFVLGGAQIGLDYGITNDAGKPSAAQARAIIRGTLDNGVTWVDTAQAYGDSEAVIGAELAHSPNSDLEIVTKIRPLSSEESQLSTDEAVEAISRSVDRSTRLLHRPLVILFHRFSDVASYQGRTLDMLQSRLEAGSIRGIGVSVQQPEELMLALKERRLSFIQMPFNIVDWRWDDAVASLVQERERRRITIHARSPFLQGLLLTDQATLWARANHNDSSGGNWLDELVCRLGRVDRADLCLAFVRGHDFIDGVVLGSDTAVQLAQNLLAFDRTPLTSAEIVEALRARPRMKEATLNPAMWKRAGS